MNWIPYGPHALLVQFAERVGDEAFARSRALVAELERHPPVGLTEFVPGFLNVLLEFDPHHTPAPELLAPELVTRLEAAAAVQPPPAALKEIPVTYNGPDLDRVAQINQLTTREVRELHAGSVYKVYLLGFAPGFPYLGELDRRLHTPRLPSPRLRVAAGSVAIGGEHTGIYTVDSPGGWNIIGQTSLKIFDPERGGTERCDPAMFLLQPGDRVRFVET